jgi:hypothetical protein
MAEHLVGSVQVVELQAAIRLASFHRHLIDSDQAGDWAAQLEEALLAV